MTNKRININLNYNVYKRLAQKGKFGESFSDLIERLLNEIENN